VNIGVAYDSSAVDDKDRTIDNPMGDMDVQQTKSRSGGTVSGGYSAAALHVVGGGAVWRF
jgi:long-chain fatty acid transport protein